MRVSVKERDVLNPLADFGGDEVNINEISEDISKISFFDNTKPHADTILNFIKDNIGNFEFNYFIRGAAEPASEKDIEYALGSDLCILALGDCGSCTTWTILDAIRLEKKGVSTISICSSKFLDFARLLAESNGAKNLRIISIEHPIAGQKKNIVQNKAKDVIVKIKELI
jgi:hypothetical protein